MTNAIAGIISSVPRGFRFHPTDKELLVHYLKPKILGQPGDMIPEIDVLKFEPWELHSKFCGKFDDEELFFFCQLKPKYASGSRNDRTTIAGNWKQTGEGRTIMSEDTDVRIGKKIKLVFRKRHMSHAERTSWVMHEYHLEPKCLGDDHDENQTLPLVICRIKNNKKMKPASVNQEGDYSSFCDNQHDEVVAAHPEMSVGELMESPPPWQPLDGNLSYYNTTPAYQPQAAAQEGLSSSFHFSHDNNGNVLDYGYIPSPYSNSAFYSVFNILPDYNTTAIPPPCTPPPDYNTTPAYQPQAGAEQGSLSSPGFSRGNDSIGPDFEPLLSPDGNHALYPNFCLICLWDDFTPRCIYGQS